MEERTKPVRERLQGLALQLRAIPPFAALFSIFYSLGSAWFVRGVKKINRRLPRPAVCSIYVRRGGGRQEALPGASDLDFFLVLEELGSQEEMVFLKEFWSAFRRWAKLLPFLGETLMADRHEFRNWFRTPTVRAFEAPYSWKLLWGEDLLGEARPPLPPLRDVFSECAKCYWMMLKPLLRVERLEFSAHEKAAVEFRHGAKAAVDFFKLYHSFGQGPRSREELDRLWRASRRELTGMLPEKSLEQLLPLLLLQGKLPQGEGLLSLFGGLLHRALGALDEMARRLGQEGEAAGTRRFEPLSTNDRLGKDKYSFAVRELFSERMILRHKGLLQRVLVADETTHIFFPFVRAPEEGELLAVVRDLREAGTSFNGSSVAVPLMESTLKELERTSFLDSPFHAFLNQQELKLGDDGHVHSSPYSCHGHGMPPEVLHKTFAEVSLALRFQPPPDFFYVVENLITLVLQLRVAEEDGKVPVSFHAALENFSLRHPLRADYLKEQLGRYLNFGLEEENRFWEEVFQALERLGQENGRRADLLRAQLQPLKDSRYDADWKLQKATTDLWVQMTPFLRLEMNAMRERYLEERAPFRV